jgi:hypothetical protein
VKIFIQFGECFKKPFPHPWSRWKHTSSESNGSGGWFGYMYKKCDTNVHNSIKEHLNVNEKKKNKKEEKKIGEGGY